VPVFVENRWRIQDEQWPPMVSDWFGFLDFSKTSEASEGWSYATDDPERYFGDENRRVRMRNTTEYLVWETPWLERFSVFVYAPVAEVDDVIRLSVQTKGGQWKDIAYETLVREYNEYGLHFLMLVGDVSEEAPSVQAFRLMLESTQIEQADIQIGQVNLEGVTR